MTIPSIIQVAFGAFCAVFLIWLLLYSRKLHRARLRESCYVNKKTLATYYRVEDSEDYSDRGFMKAQKLELYENANHDCEICGVSTFLGEPNERAEHFKGFVLGTKEGQAHHVIPRELRGASTIENGKWLCVDCNLAISDAWTLEAERLCIKQGKKVFLDNRNGKILASKDLVRMKQRKIKI